MPQFNLRMPDELRAAIEQSAQQNGRSINAEIMHRLERSFQNEDALGRMLADPSMRILALLMISAWRRGARVGAVTTKRPEMTPSDCIEDPRVYRYAAWAVANALGLPLPVSGLEGMEAGIAIGSLGEATR